MGTTDSIEWLGQIELEAEIDLFEGYLETLEGFLDDEVNQRREQLEELRRKRLKQLREDMEATGHTDGAIFDAFFPTSDEDVINHELQTSDRFTNMLRQSFFLSLYAFLESRLNEQCHSRKRDDILLSLEDVKGKGIIRAETYWVKVLQLDFPSNSHQWQEIKEGYRVLRNCIVHNEGRINEGMEQSKSTLEKFIARKQSLSLSGEEIVLHKGFCEEALDTVREFFDSLLARNVAQV